MIETYVFVAICDIHRPVYHGGKYDGNGLRKLYSKNIAVFKDVSSYIKDKIHDDNRCNDTEVDEMCNVFGKGCIILDSILSLIRKEKGTWKSNHYDLLDQNIEAIKNYWKQLRLPQTPNFHSLCYHIKD